jgi:hypothetical protein
MGLLEDVAIKALEQDFFRQCDEQAGPLARKAMLYKEHPGLMRRRMAPALSQQANVIERELWAEHEQRCTAALGYPYEDYVKAHFEKTMRQLQTVARWLDGPNRS